MVSLMRSSTDGAKNRAKLSSLVSQYVMSCCSCVSMNQTPLFMLQAVGLVKSRCIVSGLEKKTICSGWCLSSVGWARSCFEASGVRNEAKLFEAKSSDWSGLILRIFELLYFLWRISKATVRTFVKCVSAFRTKSVGQRLSPAFFDNWMVTEFTDDFFHSQNSLFRYLTGTKAPLVTCEVGVERRNYPSVVWVI